MFDLRGYTQRLVTVLFVALGFSFFSVHASAATPPLCSDISAVLNSGNQELLVVGGSDGKAYYQNFYSVTSWTALFGGKALFPPCATFAIATNGNNVDVFGIGNDGQMYTAYLNDLGWKYGPMPGASFYPGAAVTAVERYIGRRQIDLFATGTDGRVWTTWWNNGWNAWGPIGTQTFPQANPILAVAHGTSGDPYNDRQLDLFVVTIRNQVYTTYSDWFNTGWQAWGSIPSNGLSGGRVSETVRIYDVGNWAFHDWAVQIDLFGVDQNSGARTTWWNNGWYSGGWGTLGGITMGLGTAISADTMLPPSNSTIPGISLYTVDSTLYLRSATWWPSQGWSAWDYKIHNGVKTRVSYPINNSIKHFGRDVFLYDGKNLSYFNANTGILSPMVN